MDIDCTNYDDCPKGVEKTEDIDKDNFSFLFVGCWGVYCKTGEHVSYKAKGGKIKASMSNYGGKDCVDLMNCYSKIHSIDAVVLAGDNVYSYEASAELIDKYTKRQISDEDFKKSLYNMERQLSLGFKNCMEKVKVETFLIGVGNHDIETCDVLNQQMNYNSKDEKWVQPGLYYNYIYKLNDETKVNMIFIDTNIYDTSYCTGNYPEDARERQLEWLKRTLINDENTWNIVIGHIPFLCNSHKDDTSCRITPDLYNDIRSANEHNSIDLYMCADEHNQQYILPNAESNMPPEVVAGSGGSVLDEDIKNCPEINTQLARATYGFVAVNITSSKISLSFYSTKPEYQTQVFDIPKNIRIGSAGRM